MRVIGTAALGVVAASALHAENRIDVVRPDAPELAAFGPHKVGVTTRTFTNPDQVDVVNTGEAGFVPMYDRNITVEVWYPAAADTTPGGTYDTLLRDGLTQVQLTGIAARDATPDTSDSYPLVILSHGYPGNRFLMAHLGENLASKGYVVASIEHPDSTYDNMAAFGSTLVNRPWDQRFVLDSMAALEDDLGAVTDAENTAIIGYSMGGYGALIYAGAGVTLLATQLEWGAPQNLLQRNLIGTETHSKLQDPRVKAFVAFAPWGNNTGFWDESGLTAIETPLMLIAGSVDDVSQYESIRDIFDGTINTTRQLLTFDNANHNAGAPMPAPMESYFYSQALEASPFEHYADPVWDNVRMNNISQHFVTAYLDLHLKGDRQKATYFYLTEDANDGVWSLDEAGAPMEEHTYWQGFANRTAAGLRLETKTAAR